MSVGEALAKARYRAGLTVNEVSERTKIREAVIRSIEQDDYDACGGDLYVHGYIRAIAGAIGIDAQPLIREYDQWQAAQAAAQAMAPVPTSAPAPAPAAADSAAVDSAPADSAPADSAAGSAADSAVGSAGSPPRTTRGRRAMTIVVSAVVAAWVVAGVVIVGLNHNNLGGSAPVSAPTVQRGASGGAGAQQDASTPGAGAQGAGTQASPAGVTPASAMPAPPKASTGAAPVGSLPVKLAVAFGPDGMADGDNPQIAMQAITPGAAGPWESQWYATPRFGMLKSGTGLLLDMGRRVTITSVRIELGPYAGADLQLRAGDTAVLGDLKVAASAGNVVGALRLRLRAPQTARYLLVWFTLLPPNDAGQYQASVYRIAVSGRP